LTEELILGLDFGTSSVKGIFIDFEGSILKRVESKIETKHSLGTHAEQNALDYLVALKDISSKNSDLISRVVSIGLSGQTPSVVCADKDGQPVRPVLIWQDNRAIAEATELESKFGNPLQVIGQLVHVQPNYYGCLAMKNKLWPKPNGSFNPKTLLAFT